MNVTINGYVSYICSSCSKSYTVESTAPTFDEDTSPEALEDGYVRYNTQLEAVCVACANIVLIKVDVWEYPEAVVNYCYYSVTGGSDIECEFTIEHYFDDEQATEYSAETSLESDIEEEQLFNESFVDEGYADLYDDVD